MISAPGRYPATDNSSCRVNATLTGALVASASLIATIVSSPSTPFDPNPPPMCSATTRTLPGVELEMLARRFAQRHFRLTRRDAKRRILRRALGAARSVRAAEEGGAARG